MKNRPTILSFLPKNAIGCEIGTWKGEFARRLHHELNPAKLYLVDPWKFEPSYSDRWYGGSIAKDQHDMDKIYEDVLEMFKSAPSVCLHRGTVNTLGDLLQEHREKLDWVYVDGNHSYEFVLNDLKRVLKYMTPQGIICGDDLQSSEVHRAVKDFIEENKQYIKKSMVVDNNQFIIFLNI